MNGTPKVLIGMGRTACTFPCTGRYGHDAASDSWAILSGILSNQVAQRPCPRLPVPTRQRFRRIDFGGNQHVFENGEGAYGRRNAGTRAAIQSLETTFILPSTAATAPRTIFTPTLRWTSPGTNIGLPHVVQELRNNRQCAHAGDEGWHHSCCGRQSPMDLHRQSAGPPTTRNFRKRIGCGTRPGRHGYSRGNAMGKYGSDQLIVPLASDARSPTRSPSADKLATIKGSQGRSMAYVSRLPAKATCCRASFSRNTPA